MTVLNNNMFGAAVIANAAAEGGGDSAYQIEKSLRFNPGDTPYLYRTFGSGNRKTFTWSGWCKRHKLNTRQMFLQPDSDNGTNTFYFCWDDSDADCIQVGDYDSSWNFELITKRRFRDTSAWYHVCLAVDTTQSIEALRVRLWVNGELQEWANNSFPTQNFETHINKNVQHDIGRLEVTSVHAGWSLADVHFIDGLALTPLSFGSWDSNDVWTPRSFRKHSPNNGEAFTTNGTTTGTWSNASGSGGITQVFDGADDTLAYNSGGADTFATFTFGTPVQFTQMRIYAGEHGTADTQILINDKDLKDEFAWDVGGSWVDVTSKVDGHRLKKIALKDKGSASSNFRVIEIDGIRLENNKTDQTYTEWADSTSDNVNSFHLKFNNTSDLGEDSLKSNDFTVTNLTATDGSNPENIDSLTDSPTNYGTDTGAGGEVRGNYCTLNPLVTAKTQGGTFSQGNLKFTGVSGGSGYPTVMGTQGQSSGKWYFEITCTTLPANQYHGISKSGLWDLSLSVANTYPGATADCYSIRTSNGSKTNNGSTSSYGSAYAAGDILQVAYDLDNGKIWFGKNNTWPNSGNPATGANEAYSGLSGEYFPALSCYDSGVFDVNFGQRAFKYTAPSGFKALCTQNLDDTFSGDELNNPSKYFDIITYRGDGKSRDIKNINFGPDLIWVKRRSSSKDHQVYDQIRGTGKRLKTNSGDAEASQSGGVNAFLSDGWTQGDAGNMNEAGDTYVGWLWDAGAAEVTPSNSGSITVIDQWKNAASGFSMGTWTGTGANGTIGHGLGAPPEFMILKNYGGSDNWIVYHQAMGNEKRVQLNTNSSPASGSGYWNNTTPDDDVFSLGDGGGNNGSGKSLIYYAWTPIKGYSKFGGYKGNGSTDGTFIWTGFKPNFLLIKRYDANANWQIVDNERGYNGSNDALFPNLDNPDGSGTYLDILANGFKLKTTDGNYNNNGGDYFYAAFAQQPFKTARAQ